MVNFFTLDDGLSYTAVSLIESFGHGQEGEHKGETWIRFKDGRIFWISRPVGEVAEMLGSANLWY